MPYKVADWGNEPEDICNRVGKPLFKTAELVWSRPKLWRHGDVAPVSPDAGPSLYILFRNHGNARFKDVIKYAGLSNAPATRFANHEKARSVVQKNGQTSICFAPINFIKGRNQIENVRSALEELEHLIIWALDPLENDRKLYTLPGMGTNGGDAWRVLNKGYRFSGQLPREIVYPWMIIRPGRDRSWKVV